MGQLWTENELEYVARYYPILTKKELTDLFVNKTYQALTRKASKLGIKKSVKFRRKACTDTWTGEEYLLLAEKYSNSPWVDLCKLIPNKTQEAIRLKAWKLGLRRSIIDSRIPKKWWNHKEEELLKENYPNASPTNLVELFPDRRISSISYKARSLGLRRDCQCTWTDEELAYLKKNYLQESMEEIRANIPPHSVTSIWTKASELDLNKQKSGTYYWPKENDIILMELFKRGLTHQQIAEKFSHKYHKYDFKYIGEKLRFLGCIRQNKYPDLLPIADANKSYFAAMLEAEGWISLRIRRSDDDLGILYSPSIGITNTDLSIMNAILGIVKLGKISTRPDTFGRYKQRYDWKLLSIKPILQALDSIVNFMKSRRKKEIAQLVIEFCKSRLERRKHWRTLPYTEREIEIYKKITQLNKREVRVTRKPPLNLVIPHQDTISKDESIRLSSNVDKLYLVGMLEAEGGASIHSSKQLNRGVHRTIYSPYIGICNTDLDLITAVGKIAGFGRIIGRKIISDNRHNKVYEWKVTSLKLVLQICESIVDIMRSKRKQKIARLVIEFCKSRLGQNNCPTRLPYSAREVQLYDGVAGLNKRGIS